MKKITAMFLVFILCVSCLSVFAQTEAAPRAELFVSKRDESGNVTLTLTVSGVQFQGVQASLYYNPEQLAVTDAIVKNVCVGEQDGNENILTLIQAELHEPNACIAITTIMNLALMDKEIYALGAEKAVTVFTLTVPSNTDKPDVGFALKESAYYDKGNPDGLVVSLNGETQAVQTEVRYSDGTIGQTGAVLMAEKPKSAEQLRSERIQNTVIMQLDNYAAVKNGALCYADEDNKSVMPFVQKDEIYIPYRFVAEAFGYEVGWDDPTQTPLLNGQPMTENFVLTNARTFISCASAEKILNVKASAISSIIVFALSDNPWNTDGVIEQGILSDAMLIMSPAIRDMK